MCVWFARLKLGVRFGDYVVFTCLSMSLIFKFKGFFLFLFFIYSRAVFTIVV